MENVICQSCGMPMEKAEDFGSEKEGKSGEYCHYCYKDGEFTADITMEEMVEHCIQYVCDGNPFPDKASARSGLTEMYKNLKRWSK